MESYQIFIVEDDPWYGEILEYHLSLNPDYRIKRFTNGVDCLANLHLRPDLITLDYSLPDITGEKLYQKIRELDPEVPIIVISGQEEIPVAVNLLKMGVTDYFIKDDNTKDLIWNAIQRIKETSKLKKQVAKLREELGEKYAFDASIKGQSPALQKIFLLMDKAAKSNINVSITGETGTGKELVAKAIHFNSDRKTKNFVAVNMAAIPRELVESELFGYEKGAFTGANTRRVGKFEEANGGTLFLDEIGELDVSIQSKILRVLQERELTRLGGNETIKLDFRVIVATHKNLKQEVDKGLFREDLFYRIMGLPIELPPLRERGSDILVLAKYFADEFARENQHHSIDIDQEAKDKLLRYPFPGNIRELKSVIELAAVMCTNYLIRATDISFNNSAGSLDFVAEEKTLKEYNCDIIRYFLKKYDNHVIETAEKLDIGKSTIYKMIQQKEIIL